MTLTELRYIVAVARERHFGRAAEACFVSQPTLSVAVRRLEDELGVTLFERRTNDIVVTALGEQIIGQAQAVLEKADVIKAMAQQGKDPLAGQLRIGAIFTIGPYLLPQLVPIMHKRAPTMPLVVEENYTAVLSQQLKQGELDVIIIALPFDDPAIMTHPLYDEPFVVVLPTGHRWCNSKPLKTKQLAGEDLLLLGPGHCFRDQVLQACPDCIQPNTADGGIQKALQGSSLETIRHMVVSGIGITVLPRTAAGVDKYSRRLLCVQPFAEPVPQRRIALAWRKSFPRIQAIEMLRRSILDCQLDGIKPLDVPLIEADN
jgi:LysR family hydrogen peroxide-inducible transcriptional activator